MTEITPGAPATSVYFNLASGNLNLSVSPATVNQITTNDVWTGVASVEGYEGKNLTATHGVDPQTVLNTEFANTLLPNAPTQVAANKGNPSAFNAGGLAEFDGGTYLAIGFQGNVQANPYLVFYLDTTGRTSVTMTYDVQDIDAGSNDSVSPIALQYRVGDTGSFTNIPAGFIADATDGGVAGRTTHMSVVLPVAANNQAKVQVRLITTNAANSAGNSTPDEWIGVNNVVVSSSPSSPTAAAVVVSGRVLTDDGRGLRNAVVLLMDQQGNHRLTTTGSFGYYRFDEVEAGQTYVVMVRSKLFRFAPRVLNLMDNLTDVDFVAGS